MNTDFITTSPIVSEDGILISSNVLDRFSFKIKTYEPRTIDWGSKVYPLNVYDTK
jgi:hypothetical protein